MEFNWITGSISWFYNNLLDELLGVRREYTGIKLAPRIPAEWDGFKLTRMFRGKVLNVEVKGNGSTVKAVTVNGEAIEGNFVCECKMTAETSIVVEMA
jgi:cellobiose phosphorylase